VVQEQPAQLGVGQGAVGGGRPGQAALLRGGLQRLLARLAGTGALEVGASGVRVGEAGTPRQGGLNGRQAVAGSPQGGQQR